MENRLQELTEKLYQEGLAKGQQQGETLLSDARAQGAQIISQAKEQAAQIEAAAKTAAAELAKNTQSEVQLASQQMVSALRQKIETMILTQAITPQVSGAWSDGSFVKELIIKAVERFEPSSENPVSVIVPQDMMGDISGVVAQKFNEGVEVVTDGKVRVPFRIAPREGGYYVSFTDEDFDALFKSYIRPNVVELLYGK